MHFDLTPEQQLLQDSVRRYIGKACAFDPRVMRQQSTALAGPDHWRHFADSGWLAAALPEAYGGLGGGPIDTSLIAQEFGRGLVSEPYLGCAVMAAQTLLAGGTAAQKQRWLPLLADGTVRIALAYSESGSRGMPLPLVTAARPTERGFALSGHKSLVLSGGLAQHYIVSARVDGDDEERLTLFFVPAAAEGLRRRTIALHDGSLAEALTFDGVSVMPDAVLGQCGRGLMALQTGIEQGIVALCAELVGAMEVVLELTATYLKTRQQFGVAIGSFQALQHRMADMAAELELARSMLFAALAALEGEPDAAVRRRTLSAAKALVGRAAKAVCGQGIQLHGGIGMTEEHSIGHYFKRAIVAELQLGSIDQHESFCAF